jgi:hypothetical protein
MVKQTFVKMGLVLLAVFTPFRITNGVDPNWSLGDINHDYIVNISDRSIVNAMWINNGPAGPYKYENGDLNLDDVVNIADRAIVNAVWRGVIDPCTDPTAFSGEGTGEEVLPTNFILPTSPGGFFSFDLVTNGDLQGLQATINISGQGGLLFNSTESGLVAYDPEYLYYNNSSGATAFSRGAANCVFGDHLNLPSMGPSSGNIVARYAFTWDGISGDYTFTFDTNITQSLVVCPDFRRGRLDFMSFKVHFDGALVMVLEGPDSATVTVGQTVQLRVKATGTEPLEYQWRKDGVELADGERMSGTQSATLTIDGAELNDAGDYNVIVSNIYGSATSNTAVLTVQGCNIKGTISYNDNDQQGPVVGIPVYVYQEGVASPVWEGISIDPDGYFEVDTFKPNYNPAGSQKFVVEAEWEDSIIKISSGPVPIFSFEMSQRVPPQPALFWDCSQFAPSVGLTFGMRENDAGEYFDAKHVFYFAHMANQFIKDNFNNPNILQVKALVNAQWQKFPTNYERFFDIMIFTTTQTSTRAVWHEYGHFVHDQMSSGYDTPFAEGWAHYFSHFGDSSLNLEDNKNFEQYKPSLDSGLIDCDHAWGWVYSGIFYDIEDSKSSSDKDDIDGQIAHYDEKDRAMVNNGQTMVWKAIMEDKATNIDDFFNKFISRYPQLWDPLFKIYNAHGLYLSTTTTTTGQIPPSQTTTTLARIDSTISESKFRLSWPGSDLDLTLVDPNGTIIDPCYAASHPDINYVKTATEAYYSIDHPIPGNWQMKVTAVDVPPEGEQYTATAYLTTNLNLLFTTDKDIYEPTESISLTAQLFYDSNSYSDANVTARIERPDGNETIILYDDGLHNDGNSNDGNYANAYTNTAIEGQYNIVVTASGWNPFNEPFVRETSKIVQVMRLPDLVAADLQTSDELTEGEITLTATIRNNGTAEANNIVVEFYDVNDTNVTRIDPNIIIGRLEPNETNTVSVVWNATYGRHQIFVVIDPNNLIAEKDETNNYVSNVFLIDDFDFNFDGITDFKDLAALAEKWLDLCDAPAWCNNFDIDRNGQVDILELARFAQHWLEGVEP